MGELIHLELTEDEWRQLMIVVDTDIRRDYTPDQTKRDEQVFEKLCKAKAEWEQKKRNEKIHYNP